MCSCGEALSQTQKHPGGSVIGRQLEDLLQRRNPVGRSIRCSIRSMLHLQSVELVDCLS